MFLLENTAAVELAKELARNHFINAISFRFILLFLVVLLVKVLFAFFKYNIRMANFYISKRIALKKSGVVDLERVKTFSEMYSTEKIDLVVDDLGGNNMIDVLKSMFTK